MQDTFLLGYFERKSKQTTHIKMEDILFLYTDGLTEGRNPDGAMFGKKAMRNSIEANLAKGTDRVVQGVLDDFKAFSKGYPLQDDITVAAISMTGDYNSQLSTTSDSSEAL
ncbi:MAG: SpoIIE family protein phosphatase [Bdellovibrio sp.]|nr:SpoIIE family protein phosphatase [Bdellovibrio sp.]